MPASTRKLAFARSMRKTPVSTEALLWRLLRNRRLEGLKFRRQVPIGRYVADFVCFRHRLVIEADGPLHRDSATDARHDAWFVGEGFRVMRYPNAAIHDRQEEVLNAILEATGL